MGRASADKAVPAKLAGQSARMGGARKHGRSVNTPFDKYEGLGNDFVVLEAEAPLAPEAARQWCDRHFGIGADGVLVVAPALSEGARARMIVHNADGTRAEMCGNGLRCVALHLALRDGSAGVSYVVDTDDGPKHCEVEREGGAAVVTTQFGRAAVETEEQVQRDGRVYRMVRIRMGNPHAVLLDARLPVDVIDRWGAEISATTDGGANVEFVGERDDGAFDVVVWERGVGRTLACGTGAAAAAVALARVGRTPVGQPLRVVLPGGPLEVTVGSDLEVTLRGPARHVFGGRLVQ